MEKNNSYFKGIILSSFVWAIILSGCANNPYRASNRLYKKNLKQVSKELQALPSFPYQGDTMQARDLDPSVDAKQWIGSYHFNLRKPNYVVIHHTAQNSLQQTLRTFTVPHSQVSAHYVIGRDGSVVQMLNDYLRGWHAGAGKWGSLTDLNSVSIGIELDNNGSEPFSDAQIRALLSVLKRLKTQYHIPAENFIAHSDMAPTRKNDPSKHFPWGTLAEHGFGLWIKGELTSPPAHFSPMDALRIIGYDTKDEKAAIKAFKLHYIQRDVRPEWTEEDLKVLYNIYLQVIRPNS